jgi:hypothetical protein
VVVVVDVGGNLAGNVADMSRHVGDDTTCRSNFGQMGPCRRHKIEDVVALCVGLSRHLPDFRNSYVEILWYGSTYAQIPNTHFCHDLVLSCSGGVTMHTHTTPTRIENTHNSHNDFCFFFVSSSSSSSPPSSSSIGHCR